MQSVFRKDRIRLESSQEEEIVSVPLQGEQCRGVVGWHDAPPQSLLLIKTDETEDASAGGPNFSPEGEFTGEAGTFDSMGLGPQREQWRVHLPLCQAVTGRAGVNARDRPLSAGLSSTVPTAAPPSRRRQTRSG